MRKHLYIEEDIQLSENNKIEITYNFDNGLTDPLDVGDQLTLYELENLAKGILKFVKALRKVEY